MTTRNNSAGPLLDSASLSFAEDFTRLPDPVRQAREDALVADLEPISTGVAAALTFLTKALDAKAVVEIGTGTGATGLALLAGMDADGVLTSLDTDADWQLEAREAFQRAGWAPRRTRLITGAALDVLPKLRDAAYDLVLIDGDKLEYVEYVAQAIRLLRPGGVLVLHDALWRCMVANPRNDDDEVVIIREALQVIQANDNLTPLMIPLGDGLLVAVKAG
ncbi:MAG: O-methyltransferase [Propionibacteriaceae bacterium]|nr:O-methyltransferase [Propionibacteriaceae bacterium]